MSFSPSPISPVELLKRQLSDWQQFYADLTLDNESKQEDLIYTQRKIDQLTEEISQYSTKKDE